jgi:ribosomal-protein-alanine N-acetyltransferase
MNLETARLILKPLSLDDAPRIQEIFPRWEIVKYLGSVVPWPYPPDGALTYIRDVALPKMVCGELWDWTIRLNTDPDTLIGVIGLKNIPGDNRGFWLAPEWQGRGLMTEAADAVTDYWFDVLRMPVIRIPKAIANTTSRRVTEKQGMRVVAIVERDYVSGRLPAEIWEITAQEWKNRVRAKG